MFSYDRTTPKSGLSNKLAVFLGCIVYICGFWGQGATLLPYPLDEWHTIPYRIFYDLWHQYAPADLSFVEQAALYRVFEAYFLAFLLPIYFLKNDGYVLSETGLRLPDRQGWSLGIIGALITLPSGFWLSRVISDPWGTPVKELFGFLITVPEHFLIFGVFSVLLLPGHRLSWSGKMASHQSDAVFALIAATIIFGLVHIGASWQELTVSFPLGMIFAYMTLRTASIWPALAAHWTLNLLPMSWSVLG